MAKINDIRMRPMRGKGDVARAIQRLQGKAVPTAETEDLVALTGLLSMARRFPCIYDMVKEYEGQPITLEWSAHPASLYTVEARVGAMTYEAYWSPGPPVDVPRTGTPPMQRVEYTFTGWYFRPEFVVIQFFDSAWTAKSGQVTYLYTSATHHPLDGSLPDWDNGLALGVRASGTNRPIQMFSPYTASNNGRDCSILLPHPMIAGTQLYLEGISGLVSSDLVRTQMTGHWIFEPRLIRDSEEPNR